jgi:peptide/nickel transport system ATP-binding protein
MTMSTETPLIEARNVTKVFGGGLFDRTRTVALENFSMAIRSNPPSITAVVGESGSGKTTLARLLLGRLTPTTGEILYKGKNLQRLSSQEQRQFLHDVQVIFQDPDGVYNPFYRVDHVLTTPVSKFKLASSKDETRDLIENALRSVGLRPDETLGRYPHQLSGGQRQRVMVARALLLKPRLILADEPVSMIDASLRATVLDSLRQLNQEFGISLIYITHDLTTAYQISENIIVMYQGSVAEAGDVELVIQQPQHPYTQLLIGSIPRASAERTWGTVQPVSPAGVPVGGNAGCKFADRCPAVMPKCSTAAPPLYQTNHHRVAACYLYEAAPALKVEEMMSVFIQAGAASGVGRRGEKQI